MSQPWHGDLTVAQCAPHYWYRKDEATLNAALSDLVERMERKGQQLYLIKRYEQVSRDLRERSPVRSPGAFRKKVEALRVLHRYKHGAGAPPGAS